jgi:hypothetical protein
MFLRPESGQIEFNIAHDGLTAEKLAYSDARSSAKLLGTCSLVVF